MTKNKAKPKLTGMQELFCQKYTVHWNATRAAKEAGYSEKHAAELGYQCLQIPSVQKRISDLTEHALKEIGISRERVLSELSRIAFSDIRTAYGESGELKSPADLPDDLAPAIAGIEVDEIWEGRGQDRVQVGETKKLRLWDKPRALESIAKHLKMVPEQHEHSGPDGKPIEHKDVSLLTPEERSKRIEELLSKRNK